MNSMREIRVTKVTLNMGVGPEAAKIEHSMALLERITGVKAVKTSSKKRIPGWGVRPKLPIACKVTVRGTKAIELLFKIFEGLENKLKASKFDDQGNFAFGLSEYLLIPGLEYDVELGLVGLEVAVTLERPGFRIKKRLLKKVSVGKKHRITKDEAIDFIKNKFKLEVIEE